jgi:hypothetical protein
MSKQQRQSTPVRMLVDTCVWLDLAKDPSTLPLIGALEELVAGEDVVLVVTRTILDEFAQNKTRLVAFQCNPCRDRLSTQQTGMRWREFIAGLCGSGRSPRARNSSRCHTKNWSDDWLGKLREDQRAA